MLRCSVITTRVKNSTVYHVNVMAPLFLADQYSILLVIHFRPIKILLQHSVLPPKDQGICEDILTKFAGICPPLSP